MTKPCLVAVALLVSLPCCTSKLKYDTHADSDRLRAAKGTPVLLLRFAYADDTLVDDEPLDRALGEKIAAQHKAAFIGALRPFFAIKDVSAEVDARNDTPAVFANPASVSRLVRELGGEAGIVVTTAYAYKMASGSLAEEAAKEALKHVISKKAAGVVVGPSQVQSYDFASKTMLVDRDGRVLWSFYGKASAMPTFATTFKPTEFMRSVAGLDPSSQNLALKMSQIGEQYTRYLAWLMEQDFNGGIAKNYFSDYPANLRNSAISVFPAEDTKYVPFVKDHNPFA